MPAQLDHLVIAAASLEQGVAWSEATLGVTPAAGGRHALMGTHNRLLALDGWPNAYLEIIAIDPAAPPPGRARWFGLDAPALQAVLRDGPRLVAFVARSDNLDMQRWGLVAAGWNPGSTLAAERDTPQGLLRWRIVVPDDGEPVAGGALPLLIEWQGRHPAASLPPSGLRLESFTVRGLSAQAADVLRLQRVQVLPTRPGDTPDGPALEARLSSARGPLVLTSATP